MNFKYIEDTKVIIDGELHIIKMYNGMTGIGSRRWWLDGNEQLNDIVIQSSDITKGNHELYTINWRENPWDTVDIIIQEDEVPYLLDKKAQPEWRNPIKRKITSRKSI